MRGRSVLAALGLAVFLSSTPAQTPKRTHDITIDDYFTQADIFQIATSEAGDVAYTEGRWQQSTDDRKSDLWATAGANGSVQRLSSDRAGYRFPQWSVNSRTIYVLANRKREGEKQPPFDGKGQVWKLRREPMASNWSEMTPVTRVEAGVEAFELELPAKGAEKQLYYLVHEEAVSDDWKGLRAKFKSLEYGHGLNRRSQVWKLNLEDYRAEKIVDAGKFIHEFAVSHGGKLAMITAADDKVVTMEGKAGVDIYDPASGKVTPLPDKVFRKDTPSPYAWLEKVAWSGDGKSLAFNAIFDGYPAQIIIAQWKENEPVLFSLPRPTGMHVRGYGTPLQWRGKDQDLCFLAEEKGRVQLVCAKKVQPDTPPAYEMLTSGDVVVEGFSLPRGRNAPTDYMSVVRATPREFPDIFRGNPADGKPTWERLTNVNAQTATWNLPQLSVVQWKGANGDPVEGILELPPDYQKGQKVPLVVEIHGGPTTATYFKLQYWIYGRTLLPAKGYAVLCPNYRGSTGYGDKFLTDLIGRENDLDVTDILKGVDHLVEQGIADPDKLAVSGWSNGGFLTNCLITKTPRFKAAISGAGIVDAIMEWGSNDEPAYAMVFKGGLPWAVPEKYQKASSTYQLDKVRTPTLIHVGGNDERCPPGHSRMLYRALKEYVKVPTELVVYPGEGHGLMKYRNRQAKMEWDLAWLDRYVMGRK
jgi:dipeptidyl aminopeptidase/acylaminoacyl peptidase